MSVPLSRIDPNFALATVTDPLDWYDLAGLPTEGQGWPDQAPGRYGRLPAKLQHVVREPVWALGTHSAGLAIRFETDSTNIAASWDVPSAELAMTHMPATGVSGLDLYVRSEGRWRWVGIGRPDSLEGNRTITAWVMQGATAEKREYLLYLPLYAPVSAVRLGVTPGSQFAPASPRPAGKDRPICFYGTSILQGGCASRPGMAYPSIICRELDLPHINLGFSGNAKLEPEMAQAMAELDPVMYVLDPLPNNVGQDVDKLGKQLVTTIRAARPNTPIVMVGHVVYQKAHLISASRDKCLQTEHAWRRIFDELVQAGDDKLHYIPGDDLYGHDDEATVDGTHATDLGFYRMAGVIGPVLRKILDTPAPTR